MNGSAYGVHPYLLLNHNDDYQSLSTFAHEWGHAVHTQLTEAAQPFEKSSYSTFTPSQPRSPMRCCSMTTWWIHATNKAEKLYYLGEGLSRYAPRSSGR
ncbi:MAG: hypothetical protein WDM77_13580 [Steroidobacteraceae bacterium]